MKNWLFVMLFLCVIEQAKTQENPTKHLMGIINDIPIILESDHGFLSYTDKGDITLLPGRIKLSLLSRKKVSAFDHILQIKKPLPTKSQQHLSFRIKLQGQAPSTWRPVDALTENDIWDTVLQEGMVEIALKTSAEQINQYKITPIHLSPKIIGYRLNTYYDSADHKHKATQINLKRKLPIEYKTLSGQTLEIQAGKILELKCQTFPLLTDSQLLYRLSDEGLSGSWKKTGHVLALPDLQPDNRYTLELQYAGQSQKTVYTLNIQPYWYQRNRYRIPIILLLLWSAIVFTRWYYRRKIRILAEQRQRLEEQLTTIQSQLNPHFIFNALSSIEGLVTSGENKLANEYLTTFSAIMRDTLKNSDKLLISLKEEIQLLEKYISIEQLRFGFDYTITIEDQIKSDEIQVPPMLVQPLVENAVKHGAAGLGSKGNITLRIVKQEADMIILVTNNKATKKTSIQTAGGYGWSFTKQRLKHFTELNPGNPIEFSFVEKESTVEASMIFRNWFS